MITTFLSEGAIYAPALFATAAGYYLATILAERLPHKHNRNSEQC